MRTHHYTNGQKYDVYFWFRGSRKQASHFTLRVKAMNSRYAIIKALQALEEGDFITEDGKRVVASGIPDVKAIKVEEV